MFITLNLKKKLEHRRVIFLIYVIAILFDDFWSSFSGICLIVVWWMFLLCLLNLVHAVLKISLYSYLASLSFECEVILIHFGFLFSIFLSSVKTTRFCFNMTLCFTFFGDWWFIWNNWQWKLFDIRSSL